MDHYRLNETASGRSIFFSGCFRNYGKFCKGVRLYISYLDLPLKFIDLTLILSSCPLVTMKILCVNIKFLVTKASFSILNCISKIHKDKKILTHFPGYFHHLR